MIIEINPNWGYIIPILVLMGITTYQHLQINKLAQEASEIWNQIGLLAVSVSNKFTEFDTKIEDIKDRVDSKGKK